MLIYCTRLFLSAFICINLFNHCGPPKWDRGKDFAHQCKRCQRKGFEPWVWEALQEP